MGLFIALPSHKWLGYFHSIVEVERAAGFESAMQFRRPARVLEHSRSRMAAVSKGRRSLTEDTQCFRHELKKCIFLSSLTGLAWCA